MTLQILMLIHTYPDETLQTLQPMPQLSPAI
jgi:hypothetical protein